MIAGVGLKVRVGFRELRLGEPKIKRSGKLIWFTKNSGDSLAVFLSSYHFVYKAEQRREKVLSLSK